MQDFQYIVEAVDVDMIREISTADIEEADKKALIAYSIVRKIEGIELYIPRKTHRSVYAKILIKYGFGIKTVQDLAQVSRRLTYQIQKDYYDNNR